MLPSFNYNHPVAENPIEILLTQIKSTDELKYYFEIKLISAENLSKFVHLLQREKVTKDNYWMIENGCDITFNFLGKNILFLTNDIILFKDLVKRGASIDCIDNFGCNLLFYCKNLQIFEFVLNINPQFLNWLNILSENLLFYQSDLEIVKFLIKRGININQINLFENNCLYAQTETVIEYLISKGINVDMKYLMYDLVNCSWNKGLHLKQLEVLELHDLYLYVQDYKSYDEIKNFVACLLQQNLSCLNMYYSQHSHILLKHLSFSVKFFEEHYLENGFPIEWFDSSIDYDNKFIDFLRRNGSPAFIDVYSYNEDLLKQAIETRNFPRLIYYCRHHEIDCQLFLKTNNLRLIALPVFYRKFPRVFLNLCSNLSTIELVIDDLCKIRLYLELIENNLMFDNTIIINNLTISQKSSRLFKQIITPFFIRELFYHPIINNQDDDVLTDRFIWLKTNTIKLSKKLTINEFLSIVKLSREEVCLFKKWPITTVLTVDENLLLPARR